MSVHLLLRATGRVGCVMADTEVFTSKPPSLVGQHGCNCLVFFEESHN